MAASPWRLLQHQAPGVNAVACTGLSLDLGLEDAAQVPVYPLEVWLRLPRVLDGLAQRDAELFNQ